MTDHTDDPTEEPTDLPSESSDTDVPPPKEPLPEAPLDPDTVSVPSAAASTPNRGMGRLIAIGVLAVVLLAAVGAAGYFVSRLSGSGEELAQRVPADAQGFGSVYLDPSAAQKINLRRILQRFPDLPGEGDPKEAIADSLDEVLAADDMTYAEDIQPWLGAQVGFAALAGFGGDDEPTVLIDSKDDAAAQAFIDEQAQARSGAVTTYEGVTITEDAMDDGEYVAVTDGTVILAAHVEDVHAVIDTMRGTTPALSKDPDFTATMADLPEDRLAVIYIDIRAIVDDLAADPSALSPDGLGTSPIPGVPSMEGAPTGDTLAVLEAFSGMGATLSAESDGMSLQVSVPMDASKLTEEQQALLTADPHENASLDWTPQEAVGLLALTGVADQLNSTLGAAIGTPIGGTSADMLETLGIKNLVDAASGDAGVQVSPGTGGLPFPMGTIMVATDDETAMRSALDETIPALIAGEADPFGGPAPTAPTTSKTSHRGVEITQIELLTADVMNPYAPAWAVTDGMAIIGSSADAVKAAIDAHLDNETIAAAPTFTAASSHASIENSSMLYIDIASILTTVEGVGGDLGEEGETMRQFQAVIFTQTTTDQGMQAELFVLMTDDDGDAQTA